MKIRKFFLVVLIGVASSAMVFAQDKEAKTELVGHHVGGFAGASSGYGLSYRYFPDKFGVQITTTPILGSSYSHLSLGAQVMMKINQGRITKLYGYLGNHYIYEYDRWDNYYDSSFDEYISHTNISGVGLGFEVVAGKRVGFNFQFGYAFYYRDADDWNTGFDGGVGIFYKF